MSEFVTLFQNFLYAIVGMAMAFTGYEAYNRYMDRQDKKDVLKSIADAHQTAVTSMLGIHSISKTEDAIEKSEKKEQANAK
jgi:hypothetical protein